MSSQPHPNPNNSPQILDGTLRLKTIHQAKGSNVDDKIDYNFSCMTYFNIVMVLRNNWIIDSGVSDHMTYSLHNLSSVPTVTNTVTIDLPTRDQAKITNTRVVNPNNGMTLEGVLCASFFKNSILSVQRLIKDSKLQVIFNHRHCVILEPETKKQRNRGSRKWYVLLEKSLDSTSVKWLVEIFK